MKRKKYIYHYFAQKRFFHAMQAYFFSLHGERFSRKLVELCRDVPRVKPFPSAWQRRKIIWKLRNQRGALRKVRRDLL